MAFCLFPFCDCKGRQFYKTSKASPSFFFKKLHFSCIHIIYIACVVRLISENYGQIIKAKKEWNAVGIVRKYVLL